MDQLVLNVYDAADWPVDINDFRTPSSGKQRQCVKLEISSDYLFEVGISAVVVMSLSAPILQNE
jgi:hypothetical protein